MWHTSRGDRTLQGAEAVLVREAIDTMIDALLVHLDDDVDEGGVVCESGIAVYDAFSPSQRIGVLHDVAKHLLIDTTTMPALSAALEATVAAIFVDIRDHVAIEIDFASLDAVEGDEDRPSWRQLVVTAYRSVANADGEPVRVEGLPDESTGGIQDWEVLMDALTDAILWDRDFEMSESFLDIDPGVSGQRRRLMGIDDDYFTTVAPDPRPEEILELISRTRDIVRAKPR